MSVENNPGHAAESSEPLVEATPQGSRIQEKTIPYSRFQEIVEQKKGLEVSLNELVAGMIDSLPESIRDLVPDLPAVQKAAWIRNAQAKGFLAMHTPTSSPDAKRPGGKTEQNLDSLTPMQKISLGYSQAKG